ncbi:hypothetical protein [Photorhabdus heterorhabditis]|uniref:hypothetical protein n=1 Tax=Photorhabdus heterorhabditis TaxID=880156 RepID=UPI00156205E9|nr:hypothetical protein [Photorhabdus heterorhabditis]NRN29310.1 hypothetical protein [Photorhabdus heterorhabditis subsp. aluminescens]
MNIISKEAHDWGVGIIGNRLKSVQGLVYILHVEDIEHPQELLFEFEGAGVSRKISCSQDGSSLVVCNKPMLESDLGEYGKQIIKDISQHPIFNELIGRKLSRFNAIYSEIEQCVIGFNFIFYSYGQISLLNLGDEIYIYNDIPECIFLEGRITLVNIVNL